MANKRSKKRNRKLRREIEMLRAQLKTESSNKPASKTIKESNEKKEAQMTKIESETFDDQLIKNDLKKTIILSFIAFGIIIGLTISKSM